ncbi:MAG TPA: hypothetical protein PKM25_14525, partial [Candidatus Ozemobacteraceae bacterium]|nr:hypothetical protein [Candidatus Ozemobacteraceae bacterium]
DQLKKYQTQQKEIQRQEEIIRRFKGHGTEKLVKRAQSREKRLAQLDRIEAPEAVRGKIKIRFRENFKSGQDVLHGEDLAMGFGTGRTKKDLFQHVSFDFKRGERICQAFAFPRERQLRCSVDVTGVIPWRHYLEWACEWILRGIRIFRGGFWIGCTMRPASRVNWDFPR